MSNATANKQASSASVANPSQPPKVSTELAVLEREIIKVLPAHVGLEKFIRVVATAITSSSQIARADRKSLYQSALKCAQDGLLPDGREAAFVVFKSKDRQTNRYVERVQYMPMVYGIRKLIRNSGEVKDDICNAVFEKDEFRYWVDDAGEHIAHEPNIEVPDRGKVRAVYAIFKTLSGGVYTEVMTRDQIEKVRAVSKAANEGPWVNWFEEMARKTVIRRIAKRLPMSTDVERVLRRDDELYDVRQTQRTERTGADAARAMLGLNQALEAPAAEHEHDEHAEPKFTEESALADVAAASTVDALKERWVEIANDYFETGRELPQRLEAAYGDRLEALKQAADNE
jgi:recombination protein RecT